MNANVPKKGQKGFQSEGKDIGGKTQAIAVKFSPEADVALRSLPEDFPNRSDYIRDAVTKQLRDDGLIGDESALESSDTVVSFHAKICAYLKQNNWQKLKEIDDVSVWVYKQDTKVFGVFVPLNEEWVDYMNRIMDVLDVLQRLEGKSRVEILKALGDRSPNQKTAAN